MLRAYLRVRFDPLYTSYTGWGIPVRHGGGQDGLREKASSRSAGVSFDIRSTHSAEK
jgi:hypothetical protein